MKRALIDLCAYLGDEGVERRSTLISDEWLGAEIARDPWLFRVVEIEPGFFDLPTHRDAIRWPVAGDVASRMSADLTLAYC